jgi:hypothetical protein
MDELDARHILQEYARRNLRASERKPAAIDRIYPYYEDLFLEQRGFIDDPSKNKAAFCSRRAGKSHGVGAYLLGTAQRREASNCLYLALTRPSAKRIMWPKLKWFDRQYHLDLRFDNSELIVTTPEESTIMLSGVNNESEIEKFRGNAFDLVVIDEAGSFGNYITDLVEDVLEPTLIDYDGTICLIGTPNARCAGYFYDVTVGGTEGFSTHDWTLLNNTYMPHAEVWLNSYRKRKKWSVKNPVYQREWLGKWVKSFDSMVYRFTQKNVKSQTWEPDMTVLGVDLGTVDATTFFVWGFNEKSPKVRAMYCHKQQGMIPTTIAEKIRVLQKRFNPVKTRVDTGGLGKMVVEEINSRFGLNLEPAEKVHKKDFIELMNDDFDNGNIEIGDGMEDYIDELESLQWDEDKRREDERYSNDICDAALYAWREARHWTYEYEADSPEFRSEGYMDDMEALEAKRLEEQMNDEESWMFNDDC